MKAKIFVGEECTGKTRTAMLIKQCLPQESVQVMDGEDMTNWKDGSFKKFIWRGLKPDTTTLIIENCPEKFQFDYFKPHLSEKGEVEYFLLPVEYKTKKGIEKHTLHIRNLIFIRTENPMEFARRCNLPKDVFELVSFTFWESADE